MSKKRETPKRPADRKPALGGNLVWSLAAAGVATLFAISLIGTVPELELSFTDLERLVLAVGREGDERWVSVVPASGAEGKTVRYGDLQDVVIGAFQVSGKVRQAGVPDVAEPAGHGHNSQASGKGQLAMPEQPLALVSRVETVIHGPLAGHGPSKDTLAKDQSRADPRQREPPTEGKLEGSISGEELIQTTDQHQKQESCGEVGRDGGPGEETGDGEGPKGPLKGHQNQCQGGHPGQPGGQLLAAPKTHGPQDEDGEAHQKSIEPMKPLQKHLKIHLAAWEQHPVAQGPIRAGEASFHDAGGATNDDQSHECNNQVSG